MNIIRLIMDFGADTLIIALCIVIFTGLFKIPIKRLADKTKNSKKITRFITFLPIFFGLGLTIASRYLLTKQVDFNKDFYVQWLSSVSLSLSIYAFWEKFVPSEKKILSETEIKVNKAAVEELENKLVGADNGPVETEIETAEPVEVGKNLNSKKIILSNNKNLR